MALNALEILPEEIWIKISDNVTDPQDWLNLTRSSISIQNALENRKVDKLLPEVIIHLKDHLKSSQLLHLRLVSKEWKSALDHLADKDLKACWHDYTKFKFQTKPFFRSSEIQNFLQEMGTHPGNPFIGRYVTLLSPWYEDEHPEIFWNNVKLLFEMFGKHIRGLAIKAQCPPAEDTYYLEGDLFNILKLVPNLVKLTVTWYYRLRVRYRENKNLLPSLDYMYRDAYPVFSQLEFISISQTPNYFADDMFSLLHKMCKNPTTVTRLLVTHTPEYLPSLFPNVNEIDRGDNLQTLRRSQWPLKSLHIWLHSSPLRYCLDVIYGFEATLTELEIINFGLIDEGEGHDVVPDGMRICLPNLRQLRINSVQCTSLDFLVELENLEKLQINRCNFMIRDDEECDDVISSNILQNDVYKSIIWILFRKLKRFRFQGQLYRREVHEYLFPELYPLQKILFRKSNKCWCILS